MTELKVTSRLDREEEDQSQKELRGQERRGEDSRRGKDKKTDREGEKSERHEA